MLTSKNFKHSLRILGNLLIAISILFLIIPFYPIIKAEIGYRLTNPPSKENTKILNSRTKSNHDSEHTFTLTIPKLNLTHIPIIPNVSVSNEQEYSKALEKGIAHADISSLPDNLPGNTYLFAHSTTNPLNIKKYSAVFTLLNKLQPQDHVYVYHQGIEYKYAVNENSVIPSFDTTPLTKNVTEPTLTLQTCDPPGIPINRRIVTAKLISTTNTTNQTR